MKRPEQYGYKTVHTGNKEHRYADPHQRSCAKKWGLAHGYSGLPGGWIYDKDGQHVAHGWAQFYYYIGARRMDAWCEAN